MMGGLLMRRTPAVVDRGTDDRRRIRRNEHESGHKSGHRASQGSRAHLSER
jgi:hypothetical protein